MTSEANDAASGPGWTEVQCSLDVFSQTVSASEVTARVGVEPTAERVKGEGRTGRTREVVVASHQWSWKPDTSVERLLDPQLDAIWATLGPHADGFASVPPQAEVTLSIWIVHHGTELSLGWVLDRRHVAAAAAFRASIDIDEYDDTES